MTTMMVTACRMFLKHFFGTNRLLSDSDGDGTGDREEVQRAKVGADIDGEAADDANGIVSMSADGTIVAIGAVRNGAESGHVRVYAFDGANWVQRGQDIDGEAAGDHSGSSVSLSSDGGIVAIGAPLNDGNGSDAGHVRVYGFDGANWVQRGQDIDGEAAGDHSGSSVSLSSDGGIVAIGAPLNDGNGSDAGHVRVYGFDGANWVQRGQDIDGEAAGDHSGSSVSLSLDGGIVAIGAPLNDGNGSDAGHVRVYGFDGANWVQRGQDIDGEAAGDHSGSSVSLLSDGGIVAIGAPLNDGNGSDAGHVRVYRFEAPIGGSSARISMAKRRAITADRACPGLGLLIRIF